MSRHLKRLTRRAERAKSPPHVVAAPKPAEDGGRGFVTLRDMNNGNRIIASDIRTGSGLMSSIISEYTRLAATKLSHKSTKSHQI